MDEPEGHRGVIFLAVRGGGVVQMTLEGNDAFPINVSSPDAGRGIRFCESFEPGHANHEAHQRIGGELGVVEPPIRIDSQAKYGIVARGDASIYLRLPSRRTPDYREKAWDHAAGAILVEEAGGRVTDLYGKPLDFTLGHRLENNTGVIATNGHLHDQVLEVLHKIRSGLE
jgi:3'(2'), 5'-bisphosphate nucleotidase